MTPEEIKSLRLRNGLTQTAFGRRCGVGKSTVCEWESGNSSPSGASKILLDRLSASGVDVDPLNDRETRLINEAMRRGNFTDREHFFASCLVELIRNGTFNGIPELPLPSRIRKARHPNQPL